MRYGIYSIRIEELNRMVLLKTPSIFLLKDMDNRSFDMFWTNEY